MERENVEIFLAKGKQFFKELTRVGCSVALASKLLRTLRQEDHTFEFSPDNASRPYLKVKIKQE